MIPLNLRLDGFRGIRDGLHRDSICIDLPREGRLIALAGPNGIGKTTVLENLHPYRVMPSRASGYTPGNFSYYDQTYGNAGKALLWEHDGVMYESVIVIRGANKTKTQECYLYVLAPDSSGTTVRTSYALPDGTQSDGKAAVYDACVEHVLGSPEMFFTSAFSCQNRRNLSDYTNGDIKALMSELLNLNSVLDLGAKANDVTRGLRARLDAVRGRADRAAEVRDDLIRCSGAMVATQDEITQHTDGKVAAAAAREAASQKLAEAQANESALADVRRRRETLTAQVAQARARGRAALEQIQRAGAELRVQMNAELRGLETTADGLLDQTVAAKKRIASAEALLAQRDAVLAAADQQASVQEELVAALAAHAAAEAHAVKVQEAKDALERAASEVRTIVIEGKALSTACDKLRDRSALTGEVPCVGTDLQGKCKLLAEAVAAGATLEAQEKDLQAKRDAREVATAARDAADAVLEAMGDGPSRSATLGTVLTLQERARELATLAAKRDAVEAAASQVDDDTAAVARLVAAIETNHSQQDAVRDRISALEQRVVADCSAAQVTATEEVTTLEREIAALPPTDDATLEQAQREFKTADTAWEQADQALSGAMSRRAVLEERSAALMREAESLAHDVARAARLNDEIAHWTLLSKALGPDGIVALCIDDAGPTLASICNDLLAACYGPRFTVSIRTQEQVKSTGAMKETFDIIVYDAESDSEKSIRDVSGGQRVYIQEAIVRAFALYQAQASGRTYGCLFSDEADGALDAEKKRQFAQMKLAVLDIGGYAREFFISHSPEVREYADAVIDMAALKLAA